MKLTNEKDNLFDSLFFYNVFVFGAISEKSVILMGLQLLFFLFFFSISFNTFEDFF